MLLAEWPMRIRRHIHEPKLRAWKLVCQGERQCAVDIGSLPAAIVGVLNLTTEMKFGHGEGETLDRFDYLEVGVASPVTDPTDVHTSFPSWTAEPRRRCRYYQRRCETASPIASSLALVCGKVVMVETSREALDPGWSIRNKAPGS
ncbi:hypothetical protein G7046_g8208 [Stylonectria norvegica]|nr:hypothetical protein G7046_g8208 [Stylonectria norvegica]